MVKLISKAYRDKFNMTNYLVIQKNGEEAGQSVEHLHFHIIGVAQDDLKNTIKKTFNLGENRKILSNIALENIVTSYRTYFSQSQNKYWPATLGSFGKNSKHFSYVLLDLGNVLITANEKITAEILNKKFNFDYSTSNFATTGSREFIQYCKGLINSEQYYHSVNKYLPRKIPKNDLIAALDSHITGIDLDVLQFIHELKNKGKKIIVVTDTHPWQSDSFRSKINFDTFADIVFESHKVGKMKNESDYFPTLLKKLKIKYNDAVLIDDKLANNELANQSGIYAPGYTSTNQIRQILIGTGYLADDIH